MLYGTELHKIVFSKYTLFTFILKLNFGLAFKVLFYHHFVLKEKWKICYSFYSYFLLTRNKISSHPSRGDFSEEFIWVYWVYFQQNLFI